jgi:uncharacterized protein (TIGR02594 family)
MEKPIWLQKALTYLNIKEVKGIQHNPKILRFWGLIRLGGIKDDETAWCAAFVGACLEEVGITSTRSALARSYDNANWGIKLTSPVEGCVVTFWRDSVKGPYGHVGFVVGKDQQGNLMVLGGNQGDAVNIKPFSLARVLSYRWPSTYPVPKNLGFNNLPLLTSDGKLSQNEV